MVRSALLCDYSPPGDLSAFCRLIVPRRGGVFHKEGEPMARIRYIKPGFFKNEYLAELDPLARLLFIGLCCWADREGRLEDRPHRLKAEILPYNGCDVDRLLANLADSPEGFILRYEVDGKAYIQISNFLRHQRPHPDEQASKIPPPPEDSTHQGTHIDAPTSADSTTKASACKPLTLKGDSDSKGGKGKKSTSSASDDASPLMATEAELVRLWGKTEGVRDIRTDQLSDARHRQLVTRLKSKTWWNDARYSLDHFPLKCFQGDGGWRPTLDWFLKPETVANILEGKYDWEKGSSADRGKSKTGPGQRHADDAGRTAF